MPHLYANVVGLSELFFMFLKFVLTNIIVE
jgi:hypothetical protein